MESYFVPKLICLPNHELALHPRTRGNACQDIIQSGGGVVGEHAAIRYPGHVYALHIKAVIVIDIVHDGPIL